MLLSLHLQCFDGGLQARDLPLQLPYLHLFALTGLAAKLGLEEHVHLSIENPAARAPDPDQLPLRGQLAPREGAPRPGLNRANGPTKVPKASHSCADNVTPEEGLDANAG